jgi:hypothetical protein
MRIVDTLRGMSAEEWRVLLAILASCCGLVGYMFFALGKARGWNDMRKEIDRNNVAIESAIFRDRPDGKVELAIETADRMPHLSEVFCNARLESRVRVHVPRCEPGEPLFRPGDDHYLAMERVGLAITGSDPVATQSALLGRHDEYHLDQVAFMLTAARGEDGQQMARIIKANPSQLLRLREPGFADRIVTLRQVHSAYLPILLSMAKHHAAAQSMFETSTDERQAGRDAPVWTVIVRTQRTATMTEAAVRGIVREEAGRRTASV